MTGPKHLWSGDWQAESEDPAGAPNAQPHRDEEDPAPARPARRVGRPLWQTVLPAAAVLLVVAVALAQVLPGGASGQRGRSGATTPTLTIPSLTSPAPAPTPSTVPGTASGGTVSGPTVRWLGMEISNVAGVGVVIQTVQLGSPADAAGLDPGDIIQTVNRHAITAAAQIGNAVSQLRTGDGVGISVARGSTLFSTVAAFAGHPTTSP